jgi:uncharacterized protein
MRVLTIVTLLVLAVAHPAASQSIKPDPNILRHWLPLAEQGDVDAQFLVGLQYQDKDNKKAARWFSKAAKQGNAHAQQSLGVMYSNGSGVMHDPIMAYVWTNVAAANGLDVSNNINIFAKLLDKSDLRKAQKLSRRCLKRPTSCPKYSY